MLRVDWQCWTIIDCNKLMIRQSVEKVGKLLRDRNYSVPEFLYKFYAFALYFAQRLEGEDTEYNAVALFAEIHRLFKTYLVDEPYRLNKLTIPALPHETEAIEEFSAIRERFIKEFPILMPKEAFIREVLAEASSLSWIQRLKGPLLESLEINKGLQSKKGQGVRHSELTVLFWYRQYKGEYLVGIDHFIESFTTFAKQYLPVLAFLNRFSSHALKELTDPQRKNFITIINCDELLLKIRDPAVLQRIWQETQESKEEQPFKSEHRLKLSLVQSADAAVLEQMEASGEKVKGHLGEKAVQSRSVIFVGSAVDNDITIKSKYVSRKQAMIVQDKRNQKSKEKQGEARNFSAVCLSQTNFTSVKYPKPFKLHVGDIFYCGKVKYQLLRLQKESMEVQGEEEDEDEHTLTMLPAEREAVLLPTSERAIFLILSGEDKEKEFSLSSAQVGKLTEMDEKHEFAASQLMACQNGHFFLKTGTRVLLKSANEILENRLSKKVRLMRGMEICLEEFSLIVE